MQICGTSQIKVNTTGGFTDQIGHSIVYYGKHQKSQQLISDFPCGGVLVVVQCAGVLLVLVVVLELVVVLVDGVVLEAAVDEVAEGGGVVGEVVLLEQVHKVLKVQLDRVVLKQWDGSMVYNSIQRQKCLP